MAYKNEAFRFFLVSAVGLMIDIGIAWLLIALASTPDYLAVMVGFTLATLSNYFGHQLFTFSSSKESISLQRFFNFAGVVILTLVVRLIALDYFGPLLPGTGVNAFLRLGLAAILSFLLTYFLSKQFVFREVEKRD